MSYYENREKTTYNVSSNLCSEDLSGGTSMMSGTNFVPLGDNHLIELRQKASSFNQPNGSQNEMGRLYSRSPPQQITISDFNVDLRVSENSQMISVLLGKSVITDIIDSSTSFDTRTHSLA